MEPTSLSLEAATATPPPRRYTRQEVIQTLLQHDPDWLPSIKNQYDGDWGELLETIVATLPKNARSFIGKLIGRASPQALLRTFLGFVLLYVGRREGANIVLAALQGKNGPSRTLALKHIKGICGSQKLGRNGQPGEIPLTIEQVVAALGVAFQDMDSDEARNAMEHCIWLRHREYWPLFAPLRRHPDPRVFDPVIEHFVVIDCDDGTLDVIASYLLEPGIQQARDFVKDSGSVVHHLCRYLSWWTDPSKNETHRQRSVQIAMQALTQALDSPNAAERLANAPWGWLYPEFLFDALGQCKSDEAANLLAQVVVTSTLDPRTRAKALIHHQAMTGQTLPAREVVIHDLFSMKQDAYGSSKDTVQLAAQGLITLAELVHAAAQPNWTYCATQAIDKWPRSAASDTLVVKGLSLALAHLCSNYSEYQSEIKELTGRLSALPRTLDDDACIRQSLQTALESAQRKPDEPWLTQQVMQHLLVFGGGAALDLESMNPWDAMREHWRREGISWEIAAQLLVESGAIDPVGLAALPQAESDVARVGNMSSQVGSLLRAGGRDSFESLSDICYDHHHDRLFASLAALARPPLILEAVVQLGEMHFEPVPTSQQPQEAIQLGIPVYSTEGTLMKVVVYFQGQGYQFFAAPQGTYMDAWAVIHAFDLFMAQLGRPERVFWLGSEAEGDDWASFVCALPEKFLATCEKLRLPVRRLRPI